VRRQAGGQRGGGDAWLIEQSLERPQLFAAIFDRHFNAVHGYLSRRIGSDRADDLAAATFTVAFERRATFRTGGGDARPWLYGIATNLLRNEKRAERRALQLVAELADSQRTAPAGEAAAIGEALSALDPDQRDALLLFAWEGLGYEEIAATLGIPVGTVRSRLSRARTRLRAAFDPPSVTDPDEVRR